MKSFYVYSQNGEIKPVEEYFNGSFNENFMKFVKAEMKSERSEDSKKLSVGGESVEDVKPNSRNVEPEYLRYCRKFGFNWEENADAGFVQYDYKANFLMQMVKEYARILVNKIGFPIYEVRGSNVFDLSYPVVEAYAGLYGDRLFRFKSGEKDVVMSYDASYPQFNLAGKYSLSEKDFPFAHFSISDCYRHEQKGECMMLYRERRFFMPDLHPYFADVKQSFDWYPKIEKVLVEAAQSVSKKYFLSIKVASSKFWSEYREEIVGIAKNFGAEVLIVIDDENSDRYWIVNCDYKIVDKLGQSREICCIQIDIGNAKRLGICYVKHAEKSSFPVIIHAAVPGGIERFLYMIFDDFKNSMPLWLYPIQLRLVPVSEKYEGFCEKLMKKLENQRVRVDIDDRSESLGKRIKSAHEELIPNVIVIGEEELNSGGNIQRLNEISEEIIKDSDGKPFIPVSWPKRLSVRL